LSEEFLSLPINQSIPHSHPTTNRDARSYSSRDDASVCCPEPALRGRRLL